MSHEFSLIFPGPLHRQQAALFPCKNCPRLTSNDCGLCSEHCQGHSSVGAGVGAGAGVDVGVDVGGPQDFLPPPPPTGPPHREVAGEFTCKSENCSMSTSNSCGHCSEHCPCDSVAGAGAVVVDGPSAKKLKCE